MGGELKVESAPGKGSRFHFELPLVEAEAPVVLATVEADGDALSSDARLAPGEHLTALVADDSSVNRRILASLLESAGVRVITAAGGIEAVELGRTHRPDVVLMDLRMGDLNGFEATRQLGADEATAAIPVVAVSASAWDEVRQAARDAGCVDFLPKPVRADVLFARLQRYTGARFVSPAADPDAGLGLEPLGGDASVRDLAARIREAAAIGSVADLDAIAAGLSTGGETPGTLGRRIAALTAAFDYDALLRLAASLDQEPVDDAAMRPVVDIIKD
jgi:CheY-like chemotaxis protein